MFRAVEFEQWLERDQTWRGGWEGGNELQRCGKADARAPDMRVHAHPERVRHVGDLLAFGNAPRRANIRLENVHAALRDELAKAPARELRLAARDRDGQSRLDL